MRGLPLVTFFGRGFRSGLSWSEIELRMIFTEKQIAPASYSIQV